MTVSGENQADRVGEVLDSRYRITALLGRGGMGEVYRAEHLALKRAVAVKLLHSSLGNNQELTRRFEREAVAAGQISHPHCVSVSDFGVCTDGSRFLVMELLDGHSLRERLEAEGQLPAPDAVAVLSQVLLGLHHAHRLGIIHRDLKPDNILLIDQDGNRNFAKVVDFGVAKLRDAALEVAGGERLTQAGLAIGTPSYLSPEQAVGGDVDERSDLYSATAVLVEMLTGRPPFQASSAVKLLSMHTLTPAPSLAELAPDVEWPEALERLVARGLAKEPAERPPSAEAFHAELEACARDLGDLPLPRRKATSPSLAASGEQSGTAETMLSSPDVAAGTADTSMAPSTTSGVAATAIAPSTDSGVAETVFAPVDNGTRNRGGGFVDRLVSLWRNPPFLPTAWRKRWSGNRWQTAAVATGLFAVIVLLALLFGPSPEERFQSNIALLKNGETCEERLRAVEELHALGDPRAVKALRRAQVRRRGGLLGIGGKNTNACLTDAAKRAIRDLSGK